MEAQVHVQNDRVTLNEGSLSNSERSALKAGFHHFDTS
jgi:hypothetical protein